MNDYLKRSNKFSEMFKDKTQLLIVDIDNTLIGNQQAVHRFAEVFDKMHSYTGFGIASGRRLDSAVNILREWQTPTPELWITSVGSEINYGPSLLKNKEWELHIKEQWQPEAIQELLKATPGLTQQPAVVQRPYKISFDVMDSVGFNLSELEERFHQHNILANIIYSHGKHVDVLPHRASKGKAIQFISEQLNFPAHKILVAGDSGNDTEMLKTEMAGVVVGNYSQELEDLKKTDGIYFAQKTYADGIIEGLFHYNFIR
ncbi:MAG: HAD-IIB family hydrolase [Caldithrix sp.]|nr:HAD-IIB family hydrolase [Caldithrix sp.]